MKPKPEKKPLKLRKHYWIVARPNGEYADSGYALFCYEKKRDCAEVSELWDADENIIPRRVRVVECERE